MAQLWCISPKKHQLCKSPAEDDSLVPICHKGCICTPTCAGILQERMKPTPNLSTPFPGGSGSRRHKPLRPGPQAKPGSCMEELSQERSRLLRSVRSTETDAQRLGEHTAPSSPTGRAVGRAAEHLCEVLEHPRDHTG